MMQAYVGAYAWKVWKSDASILAEKIVRCFHLNVWWSVETSMHSPWNSSMFPQGI